jgi:hypothetical protein
MYKMVILPGAGRSFVVRRKNRADSNVEALEIEAGKIAVVECAHGAGSSPGWV